MFGISQLGDGTLILLWIEEGPLLVRTASSYVWNHIKHIFYTLRLSTRAKGVFRASRRVFTTNGIQPAALLFLHSPAQAIPRTRLQPQI